MTTQTDFETFVAGLENVQREDSFGYAMYFVGADHRLPFVTFADSDNEYDAVSNLSREGVYRINIGVKKETFKSLIGEGNAEPVDYTALDAFLPHPHYAAQHFVCILNPAGSNIELTQQLIVEAHSIAAHRSQREGKAL